MNVNQRIEGYSPLDLAIEGIMKHLSWGFDISGYGIHIDTRELIIEMLVKAGALTNDPERKFTHTLLEAAMMGRHPSLRVIQLLLNYGAVITKIAAEWAKSWGGVK